MNEIRKTSNGDIITITVDRPAEGNLFTLEMLASLTDILNSTARESAKVIVLRSNGPDFSRGRDPAANPLSKTALDVRDNLVTPILKVYAALASAPQPIVGVVQGAALGFGCALATACDITVASETARFRLPEMTKSLPPTLAISAMMSRVPRKALTWMVYSMEEIGAHEAAQLGIVSKVVAPDRLDAAVRDVAQQMISYSRDSLLAVKEYFKSAPGMEPRGAADFAGNLLAAVLSSAER